MKRQDILIIVALVALLWLWPQVDRQIKKRFFPGTGRPPAAAVEPGPVIAPSNAAPAVAAPEAEPLTAAPELTADTTPPGEEAPPLAPECLVVLSNDVLEVAVSSRGGALASARLLHYRAAVTGDDSRVVLDFGARRALACLHAPEFSEARDFLLAAAADARSVELTRATPAGLELRRKITLATNYLLKVTDEFRNAGQEPAVVPALAVQLGEMRNLAGEHSAQGIPLLGADTLSPGGEGVQYWAKQFPKWFTKDREARGLPKPVVELEQKLERSVEWGAVKNRYFVQILTPLETGADQAAVLLRRTLAPQELQDPAAPVKMTELEAVALALGFPETRLAPGETLARAYDYYVGPKLYDELLRQGRRQVDVMEFGFWKPVGKALLVIMNAIHRYVWPHNYGLAIILLTIIIRVVFWPVTHKSTESMKRMQEIQPLITEARAKYKDNPQKQQQAIMALYKEHKVNPMGGCLPMLIQIPVFIALFVVLRNAIELRFASFLWVRDLSQPERLFAGVLPVPLNILPILMAATMAWQQKLTPSGGDPQQQKIMMFMPVIMLFFFYSFASGLSLYWTTNQCLMIVQMLYQRHKKRQGQPPAGGATAPAAAPAPRKKARSA